MRDLLDQLCGLAAVEIAIEVDAARLRPNDLPVIEGDATKLRSQLGWAPRIAIDQTLQDTLDWWRELVRQTH